MRKRGAIAAVLAAVLLLVFAAGTAADEVGRITSIASSEGEITLTFSAGELGSEAAVDPETVQVTVNGQPVEAVAQPIGDAAVAPVRRVVLAVDASGSMALDGRIEAAREAATSFVTQLPDTVEVGVVSFAETAEVLVEPTTKNPGLLGAISGIEPIGDTALYDGLLLALDAAGTDGVRSVIVLSDGADTISESDVTAVVDAAAEGGTQVDAIALGADAEQALASLTEVTAASGGTVVSASDAAQLGGLFDDAATALVNELLVTATVPAGLDATDAVVEVTFESGQGALAAEAYVAIEPGADTATAPVDYGPTAAPEVSIVPRWVMVLGAVALALGVTGLLLSLLVKSRGSSSDRLTAQLAAYSVAGSQAQGTQSTSSTQRRGLKDSALLAADKVVQSRGFDDDLEKRLDAAAIPLRPGEWMLLHTGAAIGGGLLLSLLGGFSLLPGLVGIALGLVVPFLVLSIKANRRRSRFAEQLPETLQLLAGSLAAGHSLLQAVDTAAREAPDPISPEFNRALVEARLGVDIEDALTDVAQRMRSQDFLWVVMAIRIQRKVGGNLAELMTTVAATLRERQQLRRQVKVLSAEGRLSAWILGLLPVAFALYLLMTNPEYLSGLWSDPLGIAMLLTALVLMVVGAFWLKKTVDVEV
jgi:tight adherence protein B